MLTASQHIDSALSPLSHKKKRVCRLVLLSNSKYYVSSAANRTAQCWLLPYTSKSENRAAKKKLKNTNKTSEVSFEARPKNEIDTDCCGATTEWYIYKRKKQQHCQGAPKSNSSDEEIIHSWCLYNHKTVLIILVNIIFEAKQHTAHHWCLRGRWHK